MSDHPPISQEHCDLLIIKFLLVAINPRKALSMETVAAALGCSPETIQALVDSGDIPIVAHDKTPGALAEIPRVFVARHLYTLAAEGPKDFSCRINALLSLFAREDWTTELGALAELTKNLKP